MSKLKLASYLIITIVLTLGLSISFQSLLAAVWTAPTAAPPGNNISAALNEGTVDQAKLGGLTIKGAFKVDDSDNTLVVDAGNNWVGVGTTNPIKKLTVSLGDQATDVGDVIAWGNEFSGSSPQGRLGFTGSSPWRIYMGYGPDEENIVIDSSGHVGIGDTAVDGFFEVNPDNTEDNGDEFVIDTNGNVGIGDITPDTGTINNPETLKLDVEGAVGASSYCDENGNNCKGITEVWGEGYLSGAKIIAKSSNIAIVNGSDNWQTAYEFESLSKGTVKVNFQYNRSCTGCDETVYVRVTRKNMDDSTIDTINIWPISSDASYTDASTDVVVDIGDKIFVEHVGSKDTGSCDETFFNIKFCNSNLRNFNVTVSDSTMIGVTNQIACDWIGWKSSSRSSDAADHDVSYECLEFYCDGAKISQARTAICHDQYQADDGRNSCFTAGTKVLMADGTYKNIEEIKVGEKLQGLNQINTVLAHDYTIMPSLGAQKLMSINGMEYFITNNHPIMTTKGWKAFFPKMGEKEDYDNLKGKVGQLMTGDEILTPDGKNIKIKSIEVRLDFMPVKLYSFVLSGNNTYYANDFLVSGFRPDKNGLYKIDNEHTFGY